MPATVSGSLARGGRRPSTEKHDLLQSIRRRCPPFLLRADPRANAVAAIAIARRERAAMTRVARLRPFRLQTWQHGADAIIGAVRLHANRRHLGGASAFVMVALRGVRRCRSGTALRVDFAGWWFTPWHNQHGDHGKVRKPGHAAARRNVDAAAAAGCRGMHVMCLD